MLLCEKNLDFIKKSGMKVTLNLFSEASAIVYSEEPNTFINKLKKLTKTGGEYNAFDLPLVN